MPAHMPGHESIRSLGLGPDGVDQLAFCVFAVSGALQAAGKSVFTAEDREF